MSKLREAFQKLVGRQKPTVKEFGPLLPPESFEHLDGELKELLGQPVWFKVMNGVEDDSYNESITVKDEHGSPKLETRPDGSLFVRNDLHNRKAKLIVHCCCDQTGTLIFKPEDAEWLGVFEGLQEAYDFANDLNFGGKKVKNSKTTGGDDQN